MRRGIRRLNSLVKGPLSVVVAAMLSAPAIYAGQAPSRPSATASAAKSPSASTGTSQAATPATQARQAYFQTLAAFLLNHDRAKAELGFLQVTQIDADYAPAWFNLGVFAEGDKNWAEAQGYFEQYLHFAPRGPDAQRAKDQIQVLAKYVAGTVTPEQAKRADYEATIQRARAFLAAGYYREAVAEAGRAEAADSSRWEAYAVISLCMAKQKKRDEAVKFEAMAVNHAPAEKREQVRSALTLQIEKDSHSKSGP